MSTPPSSITRADSMSPSRAANNRAVNPPRAIGEIDDAALSRGDLGFPVERPDLPIGAALQQQLHDGGVAFGRRPHQSGLPLVVLARIHIGAAVQQQPDRRRRCRRGRPSSGRSRRRRVVSASDRRRLQQRLDHGRASGR